MAVIPVQIFSDARALNTFFDPDRFHSPVLGVAADYDSLGVNTPRERAHTHAKGQLTFTRQGCTSVELSARVCVLPPHRAIWIPAGTLHKTLQRNSVQFRSLYLDHEEFPQLSREVEVVAVSPLLREVAEQIALAEFDTNWTLRRSHNLLQVLIDELCAAPRTPTLLPLPQDARMRPLLEVLGKQEFPPRLQDIAPHIGASMRTICRIFFRETGMSYRAWRQQWRLMRSIELMSNATSISAISSALEFNSDSAFVAFFKQYTGTTPGSYMRDIRAGRSNAFLERFPDQAASHSPCEGKCDSCSGTCARDAAFLPEEWTEWRALPQ